MPGRDGCCTAGGAGRNRLRRLSFRAGEAV